MSAPKAAHAAGPSRRDFIEYALRYADGDMDLYGEDHTEALAEREHSRKMSNEGNHAYDGCVLLHRVTTVIHSEWKTA